MCNSSFEQRKISMVDTMIQVSGKYHIPHDTFCM